MESCERPGARSFLRAAPSAIPAFRRPLPSGTVAVHWLGQAGFLLETARLRIVVDPYLSDTLASKYRGTEFPHARIHAPPIEPSELHDIDFLLATHAHTDHMDPGTIVPLLASNPKCVLVAPASEAKTALSRGAHPERLLGVDAGDSIPLAAGCTLDVLPSAHEDMGMDERGRHRFLGYCARLDGLAIYHSGDCIPYPGISESLRAASPQIALLPVNGRDQYRSSRGVKGNFSLEEAVDLASRAGCDFLLGHHFGLFDFNTIDEGAARKALARLDTAGRLCAELVRFGVEYRFWTRDSSPGGFDGSAAPPARTQRMEEPR